MRIVAAAGPSGEVGNADAVDLPERRDRPKRRGRGGRAHPRQLGRPLRLLCRVRSGALGRGDRHERQGAKDSTERERERVRFPHVLFDEEEPLNIARSIADDVRRIERA